MSGHKSAFTPLNAMTYYKGLRKEEYDFYKSHGICVRCHKNAAEPNKVMCLECADKERDTDKSKRERNLQSMRSRDREKYHKLKEQGICVYCKKRPAILGKTKCSKCFAKIRARRDVNRSDIPRSEHVSYGICYICGKNNVIPGHGVCENCYKIRLQAMEKCNKNRPEGFNDFWKSDNKIIFGR